MNRQKQLLAVLILLFAGAVAYWVSHAPKEKRVATLKYRPGVPVAAPRKATAPKAAPAAAEKAPSPAQGTADKAPSPAPGADRVHLEILEREQPQYAGFRRNIFAPIFREEVKQPPFRPLPPPPPKSALPLPPKVPQPVPQPVQAPPPPPPPPEPMREMAKFTFLGFMKSGSVKTIFLSSDKEIYVVKQGSTIAGKYDVTSLTDDAITIRSRSGEGEMVIPLVENRPLIPRR